VTEQETAKDNSLKVLLENLKRGKEVKSEYRFNVPLSEFPLQNNCIFRQHMIVIPGSLRHTILEKLHAVHFGMWKMKQLARSYCWWPGISKDIENTCKNCSQCNKMKNNPSKVPNHPWETPTSPMSRVHVDFAGPFMNMYYFILVDAYTLARNSHS